jgi:putative chitobiose transport system substrate-binding protein
LGLWLLVLAACTPAPQPDGRLRLEFWTINLSPQFDSYFHRLVAEYEASHPEIRLEWIDLPQKVLEQKLMAAIAGGVAPDLVNLNTGSALVMAQNGALVDLQPLVSDEIRGRYFPALWQAASLDGGVYAIPWYVTSRVLIYNKAILRQAGLDPERPPRTWEEVAEMARVVRRRTSAYGYMPSVRMIDEWSMFGVPIVDRSRRRAVFDSPQGVARLAWFVDLYRQGLIPRETLAEGYQGALDRYRSGSLAVLDTGPQMLLKIRSEAPSVYATSGLAPLPRTPTGTVPAAVMNFVVPRPCRHRAQALELGLFLTSPQNQLAFDRLTPVLPSTVDTARDAYFRRPDTGDPLLDEALRISARQLPRARDFALGLPHQQDLNRFLQEAVEAAMYGSATPEQALHQAAARWNRVLAAED